MESITWSSRFKVEETSRFITKFDSLPGAWLGARSINRIDLRLVCGILALLVMLAGIDLLIR